MSKLDELKDSILADGVIDEVEVAQLREELYADGVIDKEEAEMLFELNDLVSGKDNHPDWEAFFVEAISSYLLDDATSPGEIDDAEAKWLLTQMQSDGQLDKTERALLVSLKSKIKNFPAALNLM